MYSSSCGLAVLKPSVSWSTSYRKSLHSNHSLGRSFPCLFSMSNRSCNSDSSDTIPAHWVGVEIDLDALQNIICQIFRISIKECGPPVAISLQQHLTYARVYSFQLPTCKIVARMIAPVKPLFKTEGEVAAMDFVRSTKFITLMVVY